MVLPRISQPHLSEILKRLGQRKKNIYKIFYRSKILEWFKDKYCFMILPDVRVDVGPGDGLTCGVVMACIRLQL